MVLIINRLPTTPSNSVYLKLDKSNRTVDLTSLIATIPSSKRDNILLALVMSRCDTTPGILGIGKTSFLKAVFSRKKLNVGCFFWILEVVLETLLILAKKILSMLFVKHGCETLDDLRSRHYKRKIHSKTAKKKVDPSASELFHHNQMKQSFISWDYYILFRYD